MTSGTPRFVGARLREARDARGLTAIALAQLLGVTRAAVSQYEGGTATPRPEVMDKITQVLNLPWEFFSRPAMSPPHAAIFYRSLSTTTKEARTRVERRFWWLPHGVIPYLSEFIEFPPVNVPDLELGSDWGALSAPDIEDAASQVRRFWGLGNGPISNVVWLLENNGVIVSRGELGAETLDGFSAWVEGLPYVFLGADKGSAARSRFDAAHELAHLVLHRRVDRSRVMHSLDHKLLEQQAHRFAGAFLVPRSSFAVDVFMPTLDVLRSLKPKWITSIGMLIHRSEDLGLIDAETAKRLWLAYSRRGWRREEPLDDELPIEEPRLLRDAFELILQEGIQSRGDVLAALTLAPSDIEELSVLPAGYLGGAPGEGPLVQLKQRSSADRPTDRGTPAEIVPFPTQGRRR